MVDYFGLISDIIGILGFLIAAFIAYLKLKEFRESRSKVEIRLVGHTNGYMNKRDNPKKSYRGGIPGIIPFRYTKKYFTIDVDYDLINNSNRPLTIYKIRYTWIYPIFNKKDFSRIGNELYEFDSAQFGGKYSRNNLKIKPSEIIDIHDKIFASEYVNYYLEKNYTKWKIEYNEKHNNGYDGLPPKFSVKIEIIDSKRRKSETTFTSYIW